MPVRRPLPQERAFYTALTESEIYLDSNIKEILNNSVALRFILVLFPGILSVEGVVPISKECPIIKGLVYSQQNILATRSTKSRFYTKNKRQYERVTQKLTIQCPARKTIVRVGRLPQKIEVKITTDISRILTETIVEAGINNCSLPLVNLSPLMQVQITALVMLVIMGVPVAPFSVYQNPQEEKAVNFDYMAQKNIWSSYLVGGSQQVLADIERGANAAADGGGNDSSIEAPKAKKPRI